MKNANIFVILFLFFSTQALSKELIIVYNSGTPPLKFTDYSNSPNGMFIDIWKLWAKKNQQKIKFIEATWDDSLQMVADGRADIHAGLYYVKERESFLAYTSKPLYESKNYFFYHKDIAKINTNDDLKAYVIGVDNGYAQTFMAENFSNFKTQDFDTTEELHESAIKGNLKVILSPLANFIYFLKKNSIEDDFKYIKNRPAFVKDYFGAVKKGNTKLLKLVNDGFLKISDEELKLIEVKWLENIDETYFKNMVLEFTKEEQAYLDTKPVLKVSTNTYLPPFDFIQPKTGKRLGISNDYLELISNKTGIKFEYLEPTKMETLLDNVKNESIDVISYLVKTDIREKYLNFTIPYSNYPMVYVTKDDEPFISNTNKLYGKKVAMIRGTAIDEIFLKEHPLIDIVYGKTLLECLEMVDKGTVYAAVGSLASISYAINDGGYLNLKVAGKSEYNFKWSMALSNKLDPAVLSIFNKAILSIPESQKNDISKKWIAIEFEKNVDMTLVWQVLFASLSILLIVGYYAKKIHSLNKTNEYTSKYLKSVLDAEDSLILTTDGYTIKTANQAFLDFFEVKTLDEFLVSNNCICEFFGGNEEKYLQQDMGEYRWVDYLIKNKNHTKLVLINRKGKDYIFQITADYFLIDGIRMYTADLTDVTELEEIKNDIEQKVHEGLVEISKLNKEIEDTQKEVVFTMGAIGESRSKETGNHVKRVAKYSYVLAEAYGLSKSECEILEMASPMHDIGKVAIPDSVLNKPGKLNEDEYEIMKTHVIHGKNMLGNSQRPVLQAASIVASLHHENWDGSGYPDGLKGEDIHIFGRITALADVFDALGSDRVYKKAWDDEKIFEFLREERGKKFDPKLIDLFFENRYKIIAIREINKDI